MATLWDLVFGGDQAKKNLALQVADDLTKVVVDRVLTQATGKVVKVTAALTITINDRVQAGDPK